MKQKLIILIVAAFMITEVASAQAISADSVKVLNANNKLLRMAISINDQKLELAKLQSKLRDEESDVEKVAQASQKAADKNKTAATKLSKDAQDEDKADAAKKAARDAERRSTKARDAQEKLTSLKQHIENLKKEITENEQKLVTMGGAKYLI
jgi:DNA repair exonuclease SbcCD ATPase subunit